MISPVYWRIVVNVSGTQDEYLRVKNGLGKLVVAVVTSYCYTLFMDLVFDSKFKTVHKTIARTHYFSVHFD